MNRALWIGALAACVVACDGQVDDHYRGEPLMVISGSIIAEGPLPSDVEPAFAFQKEQDDASDGSVSPASTQTNVFMRGHVTGSFPNAFTMTLFEAPPDVVLGRRFTGEAMLAVGELLAIPHDHPAQLIARSLPTIMTEAGSSDRIELCSETKDCIQEDLACAGDDPDSEASFPCGTRFSERPSWETWGYALEYKLLYLAEPAVAGSYTARLFAGGSALAAGYHLVVIDVPAGRAPEQPPSLSPEDEACSINRSQLWMDQAQQQGVNPITDSAKYSEIVTRVRLDHPCAFDPKARVVDSTQAVKLTLTTEPWDPWSLL